jgi:hypothetical protein
MRKKTLIMKYMKFNLSSAVTTVLLFVIAAGVSFSSYVLYQSQKQTGRYGNILFEGGKVLGITSDEATVTVDFSKQTTIGSPLIFGGAHAPRHAKAWDELEEAGLTVVRADYALGWFIPKNITLEQYKQNVNGVQDPKNWNQTELNKLKATFQETKKRNMKTMGILDYSVSWLTTSGTDFGPAKDWAVYEDLVEKSYRLFRSNTDYLEIWNEPDMDVFMNTKNSSYTKQSAYYEIVKHAVPVIRRVDAEINDGKKIKIGIGVTAMPTRTYIFEEVLKDKSLHNQIDFVSYHNYEHIREPSNVPIKTVLKKYGLERVPIFLTEWSHTTKIKQTDPYILTDQGIPYTGSKFIDFLNMGLGGANYFSLQPLLPESPRGDEGNLGIYSATDDAVTMLPMVKTWQLMSNTLGLGNGESKVYLVDSGVEKVSAWRNSNQVYGVVVANGGFSAKEFSFTLKNFPYKGDLLLTAYVASKDHNGKEAMGTTIIKAADNSSEFKAVAPANSVVGITIEKKSGWRDLLSF